MEGGEVGEREQEDMEIVSVGALYRGAAWEKKYWSCSRGKDRYPYPVGYQAVRHYSGMSYRMEIQEGLKGPLFVVTSTDGDSSTGQTPGIAWKNFQKKTGPKVRSSQGRNFPCKIDGVELFGFKNAAVQRLLRELLVDSNGAIERNFCCPITSDASQLVHKVESDVSYAQEDLPVCSDKTGRTAKRSTTPSQEEGCSKRIHYQDIVTSVNKCNDKLDNSAHQAANEGGSESGIKLLDANSCSTSTCIMPPLLEEVTCNLKCTPVDNLGELVPDSCQQVGLSSGSSYLSSEKSDLESAEQEVAKSMLVFLLPQAIPFLKKTYRRKKLKLKNKVQSTVSTRTSVRNHSADCFQGVTGPKRFGKETEGADEMVKDKCANDGRMDDEPATNLDEVKAVVADSFEDDAQIRDDNIHKLTSAHNHEFDDACSNEPNENSKLLCSKKEEHAEPSECQVGTCNGTGSGDMLKDREKVEYVLSDSLLACLEEEFGEKDNSCAAGCHQVPHPSFAKHDDEDPRNGINNVSSSSMAVTEHKNFGNELTDVCAQASEKHEPKVSSNGECLANSRDQSHRLAATSINELNDPVLQGPLHYNAHNDTEKSGMPVVSSGLMMTPASEAHPYLLVLPKEAPPIELPSVDDKEQKFHSANHSCRKYDVPLSESIICRDFDDPVFVDKFVAFQSSDKGKHSKSGLKRDNTYTAWSIDDGTKTGKQNTNDKGKEFQAGYRNSNENARMSVGCESNVCEHVPPMDNLDIIYPPEPAVSASTSTSQGTLMTTTGNMKSDLSHSYFKSNHNGQAQGAHSYCMMQPSDTKYIAQQRGNGILNYFPCSNKKPIADFRKGNNYEEKYYGHDLSHMNHLNGLPSKHTKSAAKESDSDLELMGFYLHPMPVLSVMLNTKHSTLQIYVLCGFMESCERSLYIYHITPKEQQGTPPYFIGYTPLILHSLEQSSKGNFSFGRAGLQFTPDGQFLVLLSSIKTPSCRTQSIYCLCSLCKLDQSEDNTLRIVSVNFGYVSLLTKLMPYGKVSCILICEPNYIIAVEDEGNLHIWTMINAWSVISEEYIIPRLGYVGPSILELRRMPESSSLVIGHDGIGGFCLWDICKRMLLATFAAPGNIVFQILPVGFCSLQKDVIHASLDDIEKNLQEITMSDIPGKTGKESILMPPGEDIAIWMLVSTASIAEFQHDLRAKEPNTRWRLALLAKKTVSMGNILDPRASAIDASGNYGFAGTYGGLLYRWELSSGRKLADTQCFRCQRISCIAVDAKSGVVAVADDQCQLLLYTQNKELDLDR